jgi:hypothetical protein
MRKLKLSKANDESQFIHLVSIVKRIWKLSLHFLNHVPCTGCTCFIPLLQVYGSMQQWRVLISKSGYAKLQPHDVTALTQLPWPASIYNTGIRLA